jgi:hypothetical protein
MQNRTVRFAVLEFFNRKYRCCSKGVSDLGLSWISLEATTEEN